MDRSDQLLSAADLWSCVFGEAGGPELNLLVTATPETQSPDLEGPGL